MKNEKDKVICFASSSGGHFEQLLMLKPLVAKYDSFILTEKTKYSDTVKNQYSYVNQVNRKEILFIFKMVLISIKSLYIFLRKKPDVIICTGVLAMIPMCIIMKIFGRKVIYIESFAKIYSPTISGKFIYKFADRFYVQWESMLEIYPNAVFLGGIY